MYPSLRLFRGSRRAGRSRAGVPSLQPRGQEQRGRTHRRAPRAGESRALSLTLPHRPAPLRGAKWRPGHKMAAEHGHRRALTHTKQAPDPLPPAVPCQPERPFGGCQAAPSVRRSPTAIFSLPRPAAAVHNPAAPLCGRCLYSSKGPLSRRHLGKAKRKELSGEHLPYHLCAPDLRERKRSAPLGSRQSRFQLQVTKDRKEGIK